MIPATTLADAVLGYLSKRTPEATYALRRITDELSPFFREQHLGDGIVASIPDALEELKERRYIMSIEQGVHITPLGTYIASLHSHEKEFAQYLSSLPPSNP